jgi:hypothetical protein
LGAGPGIQSFNAFATLSDTVNVCSMETSSVTGPITAAVFAPAVSVTGPTTINASTSATGWTTQTVQVTFNNADPSETVFLSSLSAGNSLSDAWNLPGLNSSGSTAVGTYGPFITPLSYNYWQLFASSEAYSFSPLLQLELRQTSVSNTAWVNTVAVDLPGLVAISTYPDNITPHLVVTNSATGSGDLWVGVVGDYSGTTHWSFLKFGAPAGQALDIHYPQPYPAAVTWLSVLPSGPTHYAYAELSTYPSPTPNLQVPVFGVYTLPRTQAFYYGEYAY